MGMARLWRHLGASVSDELDENKNKNKNGKITISKLNYIIRHIDQTSQLKMFQNIWSIEGSIERFYFFLSLFLACLLAKLKRSDADDH